MVAVQQDASGALALPAALGDPADDAVPVVISETLLHRLGDDPADLDLEVGGTPLRVVGVAPSQVPFGTAEQWIIVDTGNAAELGERSTGLSQIYLSLAPGADPDAVGTAAVDALGAGASYETPARAAAEYEQDPAYDLVRGALLAASAIVALLLAVAIVATLVLGAASRARMLAILRTLGHPQRAAGRLVAWEVAPALLLALRIRRRHGAAGGRGRQRMVGAGGGRFRPGRRERRARRDSVRLPSGRRERDPRR
jgi:putative ABC transport system permease protein